MKGKGYFKYIAYSYFVVLFLTAVLPINGGNSALNNNYTLSVRWDYLLHALVYMPLPTLLFAIISQKFALIRVITNSPVIRINLRHTIILVIALSIGAGLELLQMLVPYRSFNINDLVANGVGVTLGWIIMVIIRKKLTFA